MNGIDKLADVLVNSIKKPDNKPKPKPYDTPAEVRRVEGDTAFVHIPGGVDETPVKLTINAKAGDSVQVRVSGGRAFLVGNASAPPTDDTTANYVRKEVVELNNSYIENSNIVNAEIVNLKAKDSELDQAIVIQSNIVKSEIYNSQIEDFTVINGVVQGLKATDAEISGKITAAEADIENLKANKADISELEANYAHITNGVIDNAKIGYADVNDLNAHYANIDLANVNNAWIQNGVIKDAAITDAQIIGVGANKITAGVIDASKITVTNLNADNITAGTINGQRIGTGSLSLDKLAEEVPTKEYLDDLADNLQGQIDGQIETWTGTTVPTLNNAPAVDWKGDAKKLKAHVGDIYYVVNAANDADGYTYRFTESGSGLSTTYSWTLIKDNQITKALQEIQEAKGDISGIKQFDSEISSWKTDTDEELSSLKGRTTTLETDMGTKVSTQTFNELSQTVDENTASITSLSDVVDTKADGSTVQTLSNTVNIVKQTANSNSSKISSLTTTLGTNADGTTKDGDIAHRTSAVEQKADSISIEVAKKTDKDTIISTIRQSAESVKIKASQVEIDGIATFNAIKASADAAYDAKGAASDAVGDLVDDLESVSGTTVINGGHITTNSIGADKIKVNELTIGQSQVDGLSTALDGKQPTGDYATKSQAQGYASTAETNSKSYADTKKTEAVNAAATDATDKANTAEANAKKEATNYITQIDDNGIWITPSGKKPTNTSTGAGATGAKINADGMDIYKDGVSVAKYGDAARVGKEDSSRFLINESSLEGYNSNNVKYFEVSGDNLIYGDNVAASTGELNDVRDDLANAQDSLNDKIDDYSAVNDEKVDSLSDIVKGNSSSGMIGLVQRWSELDNYMEFGTYIEEGVTHPVLILGKKETNELTARLRNDILEFVNGETVLAYLSGEALHVQEKVSFGNFEMYQRNTGHLSIRYISGGDD